MAEYKIIPIKKYWEYYIQATIHNKNPLPISKMGKQKHAMSL